MVEVETVLVLGAGASYDFGFPTGEVLLGQICDMLRDPQSDKRRVLYELAEHPDIVDRFYNGLSQADQPSVDAWLEHNREFIDVGRWAIAMVLLQAERGSNLKPKINWYKRLFRALDASYEDFHKNQLKVITFNYDRSLEKYLSDVFPYRYKQEEPADCLKKLKSLEVYHIYGSLGPLEWQCDKKEDAVPYRTTVDYKTSEARAIVRRAARNIEILSPEENSMQYETFERMERTRTVKGMISWAKAVYFLGFGFHEDNLRRLGMTRHWDELYTRKKLMGTAWELEYEDLRRMEQISSNDLGRNYQNLVKLKIDEFLKRFVGWNELGLPGGLPPYTL